MGKGKLIDIIPEEIAESAMPESPKVTVKEIFDCMKVVSKNDKRIFLKYLLTQFTTKEIIDLLMD